MNISEAFNLLIQKELKELLKKSLQSQTFFLTHTYNCSLGNTTDKTLIPCILYCDTDLETFREREQLNLICIQLFINIVTCYRTPTARI